MVQVAALWIGHEVSRERVIDINSAMALYFLC